jgi:type II secretory pathway pseudopilin PulG
MAKLRRLFKLISKLYQQLTHKCITKTKRYIIWLLRTIFTSNRRPTTANSGFVLPTVAMVTLVVVLLTAAIAFRSFERSKNASNVRVNQIVMNAAAPAIDRARAKLNQLFKDKRLPRATPTENSLDNVLVNNISEYTFGDETPLTIECRDPASGLNKGICAGLSDNKQTLKTAWRFPLDTDNNGKFDSYALYGIYYRNPDLNDSNTQYKAKRNPLQARTTPMTFASIGGSCNTNQTTSASLVGVNGWFKSNKSLRLVKGIFVYTVTVPITSNSSIPNDSTTSNYEINKGARGFSALEYEQDKIQQSLVNNAVIYEDDIVLTPGVDFRMNGRIFTNSNFLTGPASNNSIRIYQISSPSSCFYDADNGKITVGGNIATGSFTGTVSGFTNFDLFPGKNAAPSPPVSLSGNQSVTNASTNIAYNNLAYTQRVNRLVAAQIAADSTGDNDPTEVKQGIIQQKNAIGLPSYTPDQLKQFRTEQLQIYFKKRTRRVPFQEVALGANALGSYDKSSPLQGSGDSLRPIDAWSYPTDPTDGKTGTGYSGLTLNISDSSLAPSATEPTLLLKNGKEQYLGDRIQVGNNLPQLWWKSSDPNNSNWVPQFVGSNPGDTQNISGIEWNSWDSSQPSTKTRYRASRIQTLADIGSTDRDRDWELAAAKIPESPQDPVGGLRAITGAGIYLRKDDTPATTDFSKAETTIWPDFRPMPQGDTPQRTTIQPYWMYYFLSNTNLSTNLNTKIEFEWAIPGANTPYLQMRATAVYHYKAANYNQQSPKPIACVSSFYVPTNSTTAQNQSGLPNWTAPTGFGGGGTGGASNNGIVYGPPTKSVSDYQKVLEYQANLQYPNNRFIDDKLLYEALAATNRTLSQQATIDAAICALQILDGSIGEPTNSVIPHGAIFETAFLDARQVKEIHDTSNSTTYDLPVRNRQPLEIRATVLDLNLLRGQKIGNTSPAQEYLIPNSGIIYATRDDALIDNSSTNPDPVARKLESAVDYKLDPTRRPNAIMLVNGSRLWRELNYRDAEKGFILATNLPTYIKGDFNLHTQEEFNTTLKDDWSNFYSRTDLNPNFACRPNDARLPNCKDGDEWRSAVVLSDAMTLLSNNYRLGFRNEGDYDWSNSNYTGSAPPTGFSSVNNYVTEFAWSGSNGLPRDLDTNTSGFQGSSYLNNFVTPIVEQLPAGVYLTEVCIASNKADCTDPTKDTTAWTIQTACGNGGGNTYWNNQIVDKNGSPNDNRLKSGYAFQSPTQFDNDTCNSLKGLPRRLALVRDTTNGRLPTSANQLKVLGVDKNGIVQQFPAGSTKSDANTDLMPLSSVNAKKGASVDYSTIPWLQPVTNTTTGVITGWTPTLQINRPFATPTNPTNSSLLTGPNNGNWLQAATSTTYNLIVAAGDTPARNTEDNGGLQNYVRFLENWWVNSAVTKISGIFMQLKKSSYATAPLVTSLTTANNSLLYATSNNPVSNSGGRVPFFHPPTRLWGYDVGLLSQSPDLFAQRLVTPISDLPNEYFREVSKDDPWVQNLLCAKNAANTSYVIDNDQRPSICQS